jgi:hypothetical protein
VKDVIGAIAIVVALLLAVFVSQVVGIIVGVIAVIALPCTPVLSAPSGDG